MRQKVLSSCDFIVVKAIVVKVSLIPGVLLQSPLKSAIMAPLNMGSLWVSVPIVEWHWSNLELQSSLQKRLSLFPCSPGTHTRWHNQHLQSFLRSVDEWDSLRARYYSAITCQVSGLQTLFYSEELAALDCLHEPIYLHFHPLMMELSFGNKIYSDQSLSKLNQCLSVVAALSECKSNALKEVLKFKNVLCWRLCVCSNRGAVWARSGVCWAHTVRGHTTNTFCGVSSDLGWPFTSLTPHCGSGHVI